MKLSLSEIEAKLKQDGNLAGADLSKGKLKGLQARGANLSGADLSKANLAGADLSEADLSGANLAGTNLKGANLSGAKLAGAKAAEATLDGADLTGASLDRTDFTGATFRKAVFGRNRAEGASFKKADLTNARGEGIEYRNCDLTEANLAGGEWQDLSVEGCDLSKSSFQDATVRGLGARETRFDGGVFSFATVERAKFDRCSFVGAEIYAATLAEIALVDADLTRANFSGSEFKQVNLTGSTVKRANFRSVSGLDESALADLKDRGALVSRRLLRRAAGFVWRSTAAKVVLALLVAAACYGAYRYRTNPANWGFDDLTRAAEEAAGSGDFDRAAFLTDLALAKHKNTFREASLWAMKARFAFMQRKFDEAMEIYQKIIADFPDNEEMLFGAELGVAQSQIAKGDVEPGIERLNKLIREWEFFHNIAQAYRLLADALYDRGRADEAFAVLEGFQQKYAEDKVFRRQGLQMLADLNRRAGNTEEALRRYREIQALGESTDQEWLSAVIAGALVELRRYDEAEQEYVKMAKDYPDSPEHQIDSLLGRARIAEIRMDLPAAISILEEITRRYPKHPRALGGFSGLADLYLRTGQTDKAQRIYERMGKAFADNLSAEADRLNGEARVALAAGNRERAIAVYDRIIQRFPGRTEAHWARINKARELMNLRRIQEAEQVEQDLEKDMPADPNLAVSVLQLKADLTRLRGDAGGALAILEDIQKRYGGQPAAAWVRNAIAGELERMGRRDEALAHYRATLEDPRADRDNKFGAQRGIAGILWDQGKKDESLALIAQLIQENRGRAEIVNSLLTTKAQRLTELRRHDEAKAAWEEMLQGAGDDRNVEATALAGLADLAAARGDAAGALAGYEKLAREYGSLPGGARFANRYASLLIDQGRLPEAEAIFKDRLTTCTGKVSPDCLAVQEGWLRVLEVQRRYDEALALLQKLQQDYRDDPTIGWVDTRIPSVLVNKGDLAGAEKYYARHIAECDGQWERCANGYARLAEIRDREGNKPEAIRLYQEAIDRLTGKIDVQPLRAGLANLYTETGQYEPALAIFGAMLADPGVTEVGPIRLSMARVYRAMRQPDKAMPILRELIDAKGEDWVRSESVTEMVGILRDQKKTDEAMALLEESLKRFAGDPVRVADLRGNMARLLIDRGEIDKAMEIHRTIAESFPPSDPRHRRAWFAVAQALVDKNRFDEAEKIYDRFAAMKDQDRAGTLDALLAKAGMYSRQGDHGKAVAALDQAAALGTEPVMALEIQLRKARFLLWQGKPEAAEGVLESILSKAVESPGVYADALAELANVKARLGKTGEAEKLFKDHIARTKGRPAEVGSLISLARLYLQGARIDEGRAILEDLLKSGRADANERITVYNELTDLAQKQGRWDEALGYQRAVVAENKGNRDAEGWALVRTARIYEGRGNWPKALELYDQVLARFGDHAEMRLNAMRAKAQYFQRSGQSQKAAEFYQSIIDRNPNDPSSAWAYMELGVIHRDLGEYDRAIQVLENVKAKFPGDQRLQSEVVIELAQLESRRNNKEQAVAYYQQALAAQREPVARAGTLMALADLYLRMNEFGQAKEKLDEVLQMPQLPEESKLRARKTMANLYDRTGDPAQAIALFKEVLHSNPNHPDAPWTAFALARLYQRQNQPAEAEAILNEVSEKWAPRDANVKTELLIAKAAIYESRQDFAKALQMYDQILAEFPKSNAAPNAALARARIEAHTGNLVRAKQLFNDAIRQYAQQKQIVSTAMMGLAEIARRENDLTTAISLYKQVAQQFAGQDVAAQAQLTSARLYQQEGRLALADEIFRGIIKEYARNPDLVAEARMGLASILVKNWKYEDAIKMYEEIVTENQNDPRALRALSAIARIYTDTGRIEQAQETFARMIDMNSRFKDTDAELEAMMGMADLSNRQKLYDEAIVRYQEIIKKHPTHERAGWAKGKIADIAFIREDVDTAERLYKEVLTEFPNLKELQFAMLSGLARVKVFKEDFNSAVEIYKKIIRDNPGEERAGWAMFQLAMIYVQEKEWDKAEALLDRVTADFPNSQNLLNSARDLKSRMKDLMERKPKQEREKKK